MEEKIKNNQPYENTNTKSITKNKESDGLLLQIRAQFGKG